jgi:predicted dehydrogenase
MGHHKVKIGVVGCGVVATAYYFPALLNIAEAELVAVCDRYPERTSACMRLFGAKEAYEDYNEMIERADIEAVLILTAPGTHVDFTLKAVRHGKHVLLQKPMATTLQEANTIVEAVRTSGVKAIMEPGDNTLLNPAYEPLVTLLEQGVLGNPYWFSYFDLMPEQYHVLLGGNPYGAAAFFNKDSGGILLDFPYAPCQIVTLLGPCKSVTGLATISVPDRFIVPESGYNEFLSQVTDPYRANYWDVVGNLPRTQQIRMEAEDNVFSLYEMSNGALGVFHVGRPFHPVLPGTSYDGLRVFGTDGNLIMGRGSFASLISTKRDILPHIDDDGWCRLPHTGGFNYYAASTRHLIECILEDRDPIPNVEWGRHITEMMCGALESSRTGKRYEMTSTLA